MKGISGKKNIKRSVIPKSCKTCGTLIFSNLLFYPSTRDRVKYCSISCRFEGQKGKSVSKETREKMSIAHKGNKSNSGRKLSAEHLKNMSLAFSGEKHWNWKGGITSESHLRRNRMEYKQWRESVFKRDSYKCKISNGDCVHEIHAHHILRFSEYPELRFDLSNGITLCKNHHPLKRQHEQELAPMFKKLIS